MIKTNFKKSLLIAGVLTALFASAAFAAEEQQRPDLTMRERVAEILNDDGSEQKPAQLRRLRHGRLNPFHPGPQLTEEQIKYREAKRAEWENMTPEERRAERDKMRAERRAERDEMRAERQKNMSPEQKEAYEKRRAEAKEKWDSMSEEEKSAAFSRWQGYHEGYRNRHRGYSDQDGSRHHNERRHYQGKYHNDIPCQGSSCTFN